MPRPCTPQIATRTRSLAPITRSARLTNAAPPAAAIPAAPATPPFRKLRRLNSESLGISNSPGLRNRLYSGPHECCLISKSKRVLQRELQNSRADVAQDLAECRINEVIVRSAEIDV